MLQPAIYGNTFKSMLDGPIGERTRPSRKLNLQMFERAMTRITTIHHNLNLATNLPTKLTQEAVILVQVRN
jgi:hypothetical protein